MSAHLAGPGTPSLCPETENCFSARPPLQGGLCLLSVGFISSHLSQTPGGRWQVVIVQALMASDVPGVWGRGDPSQAAVVGGPWCGSGSAGLSPHSCPEESSTPRCGAGPPPVWLWCASRTQGIRGVGVPLPAWALCSGDVVARGGDVQCPGFLLSKQLAGSGHTELGSCRGALGLCIQLCAACSSQLIRHD